MLVCVRDVWPVSRAREGGTERREEEEMVKEERKGQALSLWEDGLV